MKYKLIRSFDDLRGGDVAVFAHPSDMKPRLCLIVHALITGHGRRPRAQLEVSECIPLYETHEDSDVFIVAYRFFDASGARRWPTASEFLHVFRTEVRRE